MVDNRAHQHLERSGRADACRCNHVRGHIGIKSANLKAKLLCAFYHTRKQRHSPAALGNAVKRINVHNDFLTIALTRNVNHIAVIGKCRTDRIQVNAACNHLAAVMVCVISDDLRPARRGKKRCLVMSILFLKLLCQRFQTRRTLYTFSVNLFQSLAAWDIHC